MIEYSLSEQAEIPVSGDFAVKVIGVGGAGANVLDRMALEGSDEAELLTLNTDVRALSTSVSNNKIQLGKTLLKGMGAGGDPELGQQAALEAVDEIRSSVRGYKMAFVCVGLGGGTGSGAAPEVARIAKEEGVFLVVFATLPFNFEGRRRMDQALDALERISKYANAVITFENDRMGELIVPKEGVQQAFAAADKIISQSIRATMSIVSHPGIIRIGMDDLLSSLDSTNSRCLFGFGQAKGDNRAHEALEQALKCPLLDKGKLLQDAHNVLVHIGGGDSMTLYEIQLVMQELSKHIDDSRTQILFGTGTDKKLGSSLTVTIVSSLAGQLVEGRQDIPGSGRQRLVTSSPGGSRGAAVNEPPASAPAARSGSLLARATEDSMEPETEPRDTFEKAAEEPPPMDARSEAPPQPRTLEPPSAAAEAETPSAVQNSNATEPEPAIEENPAPQPEMRKQERAPAEPMVVQKRVVQSSPVRKNIALAPMAGEKSQAVAEMEPPAQPEPVVESEPVEQPKPRPKVSIRDLARRGRAKKKAREEAPKAQEAPVEERAASEDVVVAETEDAQKITLSRLVPGGASASRGEAVPPLGESPTAAVKPAPEIGGESEEEIDEATAQQQQMLQLEPLSKGRFAKTEPTIVDGEDVDVPTFLRKRRR